MADMKKQSTNLSRVRRLPRWGVALALVVVAASISAAMAQSTLRFLDASTDATTITPVELSPIAAPAPQSTSELHFVEANQHEHALKSSVTSEVDRTTPGYVASTLKLVPTKRPAPVAAPAATVPTVPARTAAEPNQDSAWELRFNPLPQPADPQPAAPARFAAASFAPATELFSSAATNEPPAVAQPVADQRAGFSTPTKPVLAPVCTELFTTVAPKQWDLPALDYGLALKQLEPPKPLVAAAHPVAPTRVVAKPLVPSNGTELFAACPPQQEPTPMASELDFSNVQLPVEPAKPVEPRRAVAKVIVPSNGTELFAAGTPQQLQPPRASELDFSNVQLAEEPLRPTFVAAPPARVTPPARVDVPPERLVPAAATPLVAARLASTHESGKLAAAAPPRAAVAAPAPASAAAPAVNPVSAPAEPAPVSSYKFRFAATTDNSPARTVAGTPVALTTASNAPDAMLPADTAAPYGYNAPSCPCDCPYGCGQSGTRMICGVDCGMGGAPCCSTWYDSRCIPWSLFGPGEYVGPPRTEHVSTYYLRVNDILTLTFIESRKKSAEHYRIGVGDELQIEWLQGAANTETPLNRTLLVQPDGTVTLPLIGEVAAAGKTVPDFRDEVVKLYGRFQRDPQITVTPLTVNVGIQDLLKAVTSKQSSSGQTQDLRVTPEGTIQAAGIGSVYVQGLTLDELKSELEARYTAVYGPGLNVSPALTDRATSYVFLGGEVKVPGRYTLEGPTTVMQAIALAGGWNIGGNVRQVVIFRRDENWCLKATKIDVRAPLYGQDPCPVNDVWLRENDLVIVPKSRILCATDVINLYFTRGVYSVFPISYVYDFSQTSGIVPIP